MSREQALEVGLKLDFAEIQHELNADKRQTYINGVPATEEEMLAFEYALRNGRVRATGQVRNDGVYYKTH
jgi:hypothetical protein